MGDIREGLLNREHAALTALDIQRYYSERLRESEAIATEVPRELQELEAPIDRLRERLRVVDPDLPPDELEAAIAKADDGRRDLMTQRPAVNQTAEVLAMLPRAAELYRAQIDEGLSGEGTNSLQSNFNIAMAKLWRIGDRRASLADERRHGLPPDSESGAQFCVSRCVSAVARRSACPGLHSAADSGRKWTARTAS